MLKKQFVLKKVNFGNRIHQSYQFIQFETFNSFLQRGGTVKTTRCQKSKVPTRKQMGKELGRNKKQLKIAS